MNYKQLKELCELQRQSIERWKRYCEREEKLLKKCIEFGLFVKPEVLREINRMLEEDNVR